MSGPCDDLRVIDLSSGPVGGVATMVLADFGADVVKVERPGGDPWRRLANAPVWLRGKRSVELDLANDEGRSALTRLAGGADVVVASFRPGSAERLGAGYETLAASNPGLVYCSITAWGPRGPYARYPGYEGLVAAKSGRMQHFAGTPAREGPAYSAVQVGAHGASQSAVTGVLAALLARERLGRGQLVETSLLQGLFPYDMRGLVWRQLEERYPERMAGNPFGAPAPAPTLQYQPVRCADGRWIQLANLLEHHFHEYIAAVGLSGVFADERFLGMPRQLEPDAREELRELMLARMQERTCEEWMALFLENGNIAAEPFDDAASALEHPDMVANGDVVTIEDPRLGPVRQPGALARLSETPAQLGAPAPAVGEHSQELLAERPRATWRPPASAERPRHPLEGVTVLEFATIIAGPLGCALLADLGARVIKVEQPGGDPFRGMGVGFGAYVPTAKTNAGKESICLDLKTAEGRELAQRLAAQADVIVQNWRIGVAERLGLGYEELRERNPGLVYVHALGYGPDGPSAARPSAHPIPGAVIGGALRQAGAAMPPAEPGSVEELKEAARWLFRSNEANPDPNTSLLIASAALLGLYARARTGEGQLVELSMLGASAYAGLDDFVGYEGRPPQRAVDAGLHGPSALYRLYRARSGWVFLAAVTEAEWSRLARALDEGLGEGLGEDVRFADAVARERHEEALAERLSAIFARRDAAEWERELIAAVVGCVQADGYDPGGFYRDDEQMRANGWTPTATHRIWGEYQRWGPTVTFAETEGRYGPGVLAGEHADALLAELGCDEAEIARLREAGVVSSEPLEYVEPG